MRKSTRSRRSANARQPRLIPEISVTQTDCSCMERQRYLEKTASRFEVQPVVALLGPRQCGKTTLARMYADRLVGPLTTRFDLENPTDLAAPSEPKLALQDLHGLVVIDEVQRGPELFPVLRVLVDRPGNPARYLVLGSASRDLIRQSSETLAGRIGHIELTPPSLRRPAPRPEPLRLRGAAFRPSSRPARAPVSRRLRRHLPRTARRSGHPRGHLHGPPAQTLVRERG